MGSWAYCFNCECSLDKPTAREVIDDSYYCPRCGAHEDPRMTKDDVLIELVERIEQLELATPK